MSALRRRSSDEQGHKRVANAERRVAVGGWRRIAAALLFLAACGTNQYGPPVEGKPLTWGQQHYLNNQAYQQMNQDRMP